MPNDVDITLAKLTDVPLIAAMSRDFIEQGLGWGWNVARVTETLRDRASNIAVARQGDRLRGFGIMQYRDQDAHLMLLAVAPAFRRRGIGAALVRWLEDSALTAGIGVAYVEARASNAEGRRFYQRLGYQEFAVYTGYYRGTEDAVRLGKDLWQHAGRGDAHQRP